jgi:hypothetical protein
MGWDTAELIEMDDTGHTFDPQIAVDASGNAIAVWSQDDGTTFWFNYHCTRKNIWANRYVAGKGWGTAERLETDDRGNGIGPQIAVDAKGNAIAVWPQVIGTGHHIFASRFE